MTTNHQTEPQPEGAPVAEPARPHGSNAEPGEGRRPGRLARLVRRLFGKTRKRAKAQNPNIYPLY
ncbi:MAG: hypothetical protein DRQ55_14620 [Planctomycetota bacterium]|nr:MAG: hypothetical protein DRQ55_14620 [Planctomycetota bacterium]